MRIVSNGEIDRSSFGDGSDQDIAAELEELRAKLDRLGQQVATQTAHVRAEAVHSVIRARAVRLQLFDADLFADPAWDMLLHLFAQELEHQRVAVSKLCEASGAPETTALRHLGALVRRGLVTRRPDERDARRVWVELSPAGSGAMRRYFQWLLAAA